MRIVQLRIARHRQAKAGPIKYELKAKPVNPCFLVRRNE